MEEIFEKSVDGTLELIRQQLGQIASKRLRARVCSHLAKDPPLG
jgi:hypothetical protein